jgi:hypothetical protein
MLAVKQDVVLWNLPPLSRADSLNCLLFFVDLILLWHAVHRFVVSISTDESFCSVNSGPVIFM